jgi:hypothetical protein
VIRTGIDDLAVESICNKLFQLNRELFAEEELDEAGNIIYRYSSNSKMSLFTKKQGRANYGAFLKMRLTNSCYPPMVQLLSLTTRKMDGKGCVFIKKRTARQCTTQSGCSGGASYTYVSRELQSQVSSQHSITMEKGVM